MVNLEIIINNKMMPILTKFKEINSNIMVMTNYLVIALPK